MGSIMVFVCFNGGPPVGVRNEGDQGLIGFDVGTEGWIVRPEWPQTP